MYNGTIETRNVRELPAVEFLAVLKREHRHPLYLMLKGAVVFFTCEPRSKARRDFESAIRRGLYFYPEMEIRFEIDDGIYVWEVREKPVS